MSIRLSRKAIRLYNNIEFTLQQMSQRQFKERSAGIWARMAQMKIDTNTSATTYVPEFGNFFFLEVSHPQVVLKGKKGIDRRLSILFDGKLSTLFDRRFR